MVLLRSMVYASMCLYGNIISTILAYSVRNEIIRLRGVLLHFEPGRARIVDSLQTVKAVTRKILLIY